MIKRWGLLASIVGILLAHAALAQEVHQDRWWRIPAVAQQLKLTDSEIQRLEEAFNESRLQMIKQKSRVEAEQFKLQSLLEKPNLDEAAVKAQNRELEEARSALANERTAFILKVRRIIGHERFQRLADMRPK